MIAKKRCVTRVATGWWTPFGCVLTLDTLAGGNDQGVRQMYLPDFLLGHG
jgi:hypothetical protein